MAVTDGSGELYRNSEDCSTDRNHAESTGSAEHLKSAGRCSAGCGSGRCGAYFHRQRFYLFGSDLYETGCSKGRRGTPDRRIFKPSSPVQKFRKSIKRIWKQRCESTEQVKQLEANWQNVPSTVRIWSSSPITIGQEQKNTGFWEKSRRQQVHLPSVVMFLPPSRCHCKRSVRHYGAAAETEGIKRKKSLRYFFTIIGFPNRWKVCLASFGLPAKGK